jgi:hypothetical protein
MNTSQIVTALASDPIVSKCFAGVFACDQLPKKINKFPTALVANTDPSNERGEHWIAMYFDKHKNAEYFDSYGMPPSNCDLYKFFQSNGKNHKCNETQLQAISSIVCGHWAIGFLAKRCREHSMTSFIKQFKGLKPGVSDSKIASLVTTLYNIKPVRTRRQVGGVQHCCARVHHRCK